VFGPSGYLFKLVPLALSCAYIFVVYLSLYRFFGKKLALIAAALFSIFAPFVAFNFYGGSVTTLLGWLGLYFFFRSYFAESEKPGSLILSGASFGFAYYCFDYALYYLFAVIMLWILKDNIRLWRRWRSVLSLLLGFAIGASLLIYYNVTHEFANIKHLANITANPGSTLAPGTLTRFARLLYHDLPAFFSLDVEDFSKEISPISYFSYGLFVIALGYVFMRTGEALFSAMRSFFARKITVFTPERRIIYFVLFLLAYFAIYSLSRAGGKAPRYLIVICPFIPIIVGWAAYDLAKRHRVAAGIFVILFTATQIPFIVEFARDTTVPEWDVRMHGEDIKTLANFLLDNNLTTVVTPYEIKWKLMFESRRKIVCAAYLFGFDREYKYNLEVADRINNKGVSPAFVFDKEHKLAQAARHFNPDGGFDVGGFHEFLRQNRIAYQISPVGRDYVVYHGFSKHFTLPDPDQESVQILKKVNEGLRKEP
jgi:4-amino-4-deoxy-L-arabinose transferase-like glycosyltransferase